MVLEYDSPYPQPSTLSPDSKVAHELHEREFFIYNLLVRIHLIIQIILVDRPCAMGV